LYLKPSPISIDPDVRTKEITISNKARIKPTVMVFLSEVNIELIKIPQFAIGINNNIIHHILKD